MNSSQQPPTEPSNTSASPATSSRRQQTVWQVAPTVPDRRRRIQFGMGTMFVITSIGGPLLAAAMMLPREFYQLNAQIAGVIALSLGLAFMISFCRPRWAFAVMALTICFGFAAHVALYTNRFQLGETEQLRLLVLAWGSMITAGIGFVFSYARHDQ